MHEYSLQPTFGLKAPLEILFFKCTEKKARSKSPFEAGPLLVALDSGLCEDKDVSTCDKAEKIETIQSILKGKAFGDCSLKRKNQIVTLKSLTSLDRLTLFFRLLVVVERKLELLTFSKTHYAHTQCP